MKVLITGANSLLGSNLTRKLLQANYEVKAMVRESSNLLSLSGISPEIFYGNFTKQADVRKALSGCQVLVHVAANTSQWAPNYQHYKAINVDATQLLLEESLKADIQQFVYVGSANAFAPGTKEHPGNESSKFTGIQAQSGYMRSKYEAQQLVLQFHREHQLPAIVVNPTFMLGKYDAKPSSGQMLLMAYGKSLMPCPPGGKNFIHVDDVATGIVNAIEKGENGECYLLANKNLSYFDFFKIMKKVTGYPARLIKLPPIALYAAGKVGSLLEIIQGKPAKLNTINAQLLGADNYYSSAKAIEKLQLPQTPIELAIEDAISWFEEHAYLK